MTEAPTKQTILKFRDYFSLKYFSKLIAKILYFSIYFSFLKTYCKILKKKGIWNHRHFFFFFFFWQNLNQNL